LALNATKATRRKEICKRNYSFHAPLQEPEAQEELLRNAQLQEDFLQNLPTLEDHLAEVYAEGAGGGSQFMRKGKTRTRNARVDLMRTRAANARRKAREQAVKTARKSYDRQQYDKPQAEES